MNLEKNATFMGSMLHCTKDEDTFGWFALKLLATDPKLIELKDLGFDMKSAIYQGFKNFIPSINHLLCEKLKTEGRKKHDKLLNRLKQNAASYQHAKFSISQHIYGCRTDGFNRLVLF